MTLEELKLKLKSLLHEDEGRETDIKAVGYLLEYINEEEVYRLYEEVIGL